MERNWEKKYYCDHYQAGGPQVLRNMKNCKGLGRNFVSGRVFSSVSTLAALFNILGIVFIGMVTIFVRDCYRLKGRGKPTLGNIESLVQCLEFCWRFGRSAHPLIRWSAGNDATPQSCCSGGTATSTSRFSSIFSSFLDTFLIHLLVYFFGFSWYSASERTKR